MLRFVDSFDHYSTLLRKWTSIGGVAGAIESGAGRNGTDSFRAAMSGGSSTAKYLNKTIDAQSTWIVGFAFKFDATIPTTLIISQLFDSGTTQCELRILTDGTLRVTRNSTTLGTTAFALSADTQYYIEWKVFINDSTGTVEVRVNGDAKLSLTGQDTKNTANATANTVAMGIGTNTNQPINFDFDDLYICDDKGGVNDDFLGDVRIEAIFPTGAGSSAQWTRGGSDSGANWSQVEETTPNDDTDYNTSSTATDTDLFAYGDVTPTSGTVKGVQVIPLARKDDAGSRTIRTKAKSGTTTGSGANADLTDSYLYHPHVFETNPDTAAAWTISEVNGAEFGYEEVA